MELSKLITLDRVRVPINAGDKHAAITELVDVLSETGGLVDRDAALEAVLKREAERTTGIGYGLAIPHGKSSGCRGLVMAAGKPAQPIDFQSLDRRPVTFVVLLVSPPDQTGPHIQALAKISRLMNIEAFREAVEHASSSADLHAAITTYEAHENGG
jgi:mannitol/fructose-specific phosphotransferase system IIA component (Ntr-type)